MKMRFAFVALLSVLAVVAHAQDTVLYGKFHASIDFVDNGGEGDSTSSVNVSSNSSRFGIKGSEQIAPGLKGIFQVENNLNFSGQGSSGDIAGRNTFVGLQGGFGSIRIGKIDSPMKSVGRMADLFGDQAGDSRNIIGGVDFDERYADSIYYTTPGFSGFTVSLQYVPDETDITDKAADKISVNAIYKAKLFDIGVGYEQAEEGSAGAGERADGVRLAGNVRLGAIRIAALYQTFSFDDEDAAAYGLGASYKFGQNLIKAQYYATDNEGEDTNAQLFALGFERSLSKRTKAYAIYAQTANDDDSALSSFGGGHGGIGIGTEPGETFSGFSLGVEHNF